MRMSLPPTRRWEMHMDGDQVDRDSMHDDMYVPSGPRRNTHTEHHPSDSFHSKATHAPHPKSQRHPCGFCGCIIDRHIVRHIGCHLPPQEDGRCVWMETKMTDIRSTTTCVCPLDPDETHTHNTIRQSEVFTPRQRTHLSTTTAFSLRIYH